MSENDPVAGSPVSSRDELVQLSDVSRRRLFNVGGASVAAGVLAFAGVGLRASPSQAQIIPGVAGVFMSAFMSDEAFRNAMTSGDGAQIQAALNGIGIDPLFDPDAGEDLGGNRPLWLEIRDTPGTTWQGLEELYKAMADMDGSQ